MNHGEGNDDHIGETYHYSLIMNYSNFNRTIVIYNNIYIYTD